MHVAASAWVGVTLLAGCAGSPAVGPEGAGGEPAAKNVIVMVADGAGFNPVEATAMWQGRRGRLIVAGGAWTRVAMATYTLRGQPHRPIPGEAGLAQDPQRVYDSAKAWDTTPIEGEHDGFPFFFEGYRWHRATAPDSAATATAISTGVRTYDSSINLGGSGQRLRTLAQMFSDDGRSAGSVSSVTLSHATPAALGGAHYPTRHEYAAIANDMLSADTLDVLMGGGHPAFDHNGRPRDPGEDDYRFVGGPDTWAALQAGEHAGGWTLVDAPAELERIAAGDAPDRLLFVAPVAETLQQLRTASRDWNGDGVVDDEDRRVTRPGDDPPVPTTPTLAQMTRAALGALGDNPRGFYLHIEGGAVDWAQHSRQLGRMIEEYSAFLDAVQAVSDYLDRGEHGHDWSNTLVIVTADHDHLLVGPDGDRVPFQPLEDRGAGELPGHRWVWRSHSNHLVPLFARGPGAAAIIDAADRIDYHEAGGRVFGRGAYLHQIDLFEVMRQAAGVR